MVNLRGDLIVSEQQAEQTSGETGSLNAGPAAPHSPDAPAEPVTAAVEAPATAPEAAAEAPKVEAPKVEMSKADAPKAEAAKAEAPKVEAPKADAPRVPGKVMIMSSGDRAWDSKAAGAKADNDEGMFGKRRLSALAAVVALAALAGALGGALATAGVEHFADAASTGNGALETTVARLDADMLALKASVEHTSKMSVSQFNKTNDRLDKVEKAQLEPAAKLAKLTETVDKLHAAQAAPAAPAPVAAAAAREVTGSVAPPATTAAAAPPKVEVGRLPIVENWVLRDVGHGGALIEGRQGIFEVYPGDPVPGLGRVDAVRRQDGRWVVVTTKGLIAAR
jgi:hypothetical protein